MGVVLPVHEDEGMSDQLKKLFRKMTLFRETEDSAVDPAGTRYRGSAACVSE
jgi:hypothetical protein